MPAPAYDAKLRRLSAHASAIAEISLSAFSDASAMPHLLMSTSLFTFGVSIARHLL